MTDRADVGGAAGPGASGQGRAPHALHLLLPALACWGVAFVTLGRTAPVAWGIGALAALAALCVGRWHGLASGRRHTVIAVLGCAAAVAVGVGFRVHTVTTGPVALLARKGATVTAEVVLTDDPRVLPGGGGLVRRDRVVVEARMELVEEMAGEAAGRRFAVRTPVVLLGSGPGWRPLLPSQRIRIRGRLSPGEPGELTAATVLVRGPPEALTAPSLTQRVAGRLRAGLREAA
ncbi:MAG TPA: ComEC/Rec2 family competence protein, partial [Thermopolyspora sp.]